MAMVAAIAGIASSLVGTVVGVSGAQYQAQAASNMYNYQAKVAQQNAQYETQLGEVNAQRQGLKTKAMLGGILSQQGAGNVAIGSGTNKSVADSAESLGQFDESNIRSDAARRAYNFETAAAMDTASAQNAKTAGDYSMASSLLGGIGSVSDKWMQASKSGLFN
jgi:hypothetical protein